MPRYRSIKDQSADEKDRKWSLARLLYFHIERINVNSVYASNVSADRLSVPADLRNQIYFDLERRGYQWSGAEWEYIRRGYSIYDPLSEDYLNLLESYNNKGQ